MPFLPETLTLYIARSAAWMSSSADAATSGSVAMPTDAVRRTLSWSAVEKAVRRDPVANALGDHDRAVAPGLGQDHRELVAAKPRDDVGLAGAPADDRGGLDERTAARQVPVGVVHGLEPVQIDEQQRQRRCRCGPRASSRDAATGS